MNAYFDAVQAALENYGLLLPDPGRPVTEPAQEAPAEGTQDAPETPAELKEEKDG